MPVRKQVPGASLGTWGHRDPRWVMAASPTPRPRAGPGCSPGPTLAHRRTVHGPIRLGPVHGLVPEQMAEEELGHRRALGTGPDMVSSDHCPFDCAVQFTKRLRDT